MAQVNSNGVPSPVVKPPADTGDRPARGLSDGEIALACVDLAATPERAFQALFTLDMERWWGASGVYRVRNWQAEFRVGGAWNLDIELPDGTTLPASGEFLAIDAPHRVVLTRRYDWDHPTLGRRVTRVTYLLEPRAGGTRLTVRHDDFGNATAAREHADGWERMLGWLAEYLRADAPAAPRIGVGNHAAVIVPRKDRDAIRQFYCGVLGAVLTRSNDQKDDLCIGGNFYIAMMYGEDVDNTEFLRSGRSVWLEITTDNVAALRDKILAFGVRKLDVPDPHLYFQAPGGQVLRLVGRDEDLSHYEGTGAGPDAGKVKQAIRNFE